VVAQLNLSTTSFNCICYCMCLKLIIYKHFNICFTESVWLIPTGSSIRDVSRRDHVVRI